jgi:hypothetical protein
MGVAAADVAAVAARIEVGTVALLLVTAGTSDVGDALAGWGPAALSDEPRSCCSLSGLAGAGFALR